MNDGRTQTDYRARFDQLQARFIDEPREAVQAAGSLVREAVDSMFRGDQDTEGLRRLMQGYRDLLTRIDSTGHEQRSTHENGDQTEEPAAAAASRTRPREMREGVDERPEA